MRAGVVLAFLFLMATFVLPALFDAGSIGDDRGGATNGAAQISFILHNPVTYTKILAENIFGCLGEFLFGYVFSLLGHAGTAPGGLWFTVLAVVVLFTDHKEGIAVLRGKKKLWAFLCCSASIVLIWTALYISFTVPGSAQIMGVQARYMLPILTIIYLVFFTDKIKIVWNWARYQFLIYGSSCILLFWTLYRCIFVPMCR